MKYLFVIIFSLTAVGLKAQQQSSQWQSPNNIVELCKNIENSIINAYKAEIAANNKNINSQLSIAERNEASDMSDAARQFQRLNEDRWYKLGCTYLLYKK
jgi:hypothetical protein